MADCKTCIESLWDDITGRLRRETGESPVCNLLPGLHNGHLNAKNKERERDHV